MKKLLWAMVSLLFLLTVSVPAVAAADVPYLVDDADLLTPSEEARLEAQLADLSDTLGLDIVLVTTEDTGGRGAVRYADDFYDYGGYGPDGILWLIDMGERYAYFSTSGYGITVFTDAGIEHMLDVLNPMLSDGEFAPAVEAYMGLCEDYVQQAKTGVPYDSHNLPKEPFSFGFSLVISLVVGLVVALIATAVMKGQLKSVRKKGKASEYMKTGSLVVTEASDLFLYRNVTRIARPKNSGSSSHRSSSGRSHGGGGRGF